MVISFLAAGNNFLHHPGSRIHPALESILLRELKKESDAVMGRISPILSKQYCHAGDPPTRGQARSFGRPPRDPTRPARPTRGYDPHAKPDPAANRIRMTPIPLTFPPPKPGMFRTDKVFAASSRPAPESMSSGSTTRSA